MTTIGTLIDYHYSLNLRCCAEACNHQERLDLAELASKLGRSHSCLAQDISAHIQCAKCHSSHVNVILSSEALNRAEEAALKSSPEGG